MIAFAGLLLFFFLDYVRPTNLVPGLEVLHLNSLVPLFVVLATLRSRVDHGQPPRGEPSNFAMIFGFLGLIVASAAFADVTERVFNVFIAVAGYAAIFWTLTEQVNSLDRLKTVVKALLLVHVIVAALNPIMFTDPDVRHYVSSGAFLGDGNDFALSVNIVVPLCLYLVTDAVGTPRKLFWTLALVVCLACVVLTKSRGATVALACVAAYYWSKSNRKMTFVLAAAAVVVLIMLFAPPTYFERMSSIADSQEGSAQGRIQAWWGGTRMALDYPLTGVGAGNFPIAYGTHYKLAEDVPWQTAHSIYFLTLGELGFPGLALLLAIIIRNLTANRRLMKQLAADPGDRFAREQQLLAALSASMVGFATGGAFLSAVYYPHMYILVGLFTAARRLVRQQVAVVDTAPGATALATQRPIVRPGQLAPEWQAARLQGGAAGPHAVQHR